MKPPPINPESSSSARPPAVLVTGGAGFLGSHVAEALVGMGRRVVILDDLSGGDARNVPAGAVFVQGSILDAALVERLFAEWRFVHVYHLAAYAAEVLSHRVRRFTYENNLLGSAGLVNAAVRSSVRCFVFASSIAVYGEPSGPATEDTPRCPIDPYGIAKYAAELDLEAAGRLFGLPWVVFRPHNIYGERQHLGDAHRNVVAIFLRHALEGRPLPVYGDGNQRRAFTYVGDVAPVLARAPDVAAAYGRAFNVGADVSCTVNELACKVSEAVGVPLRIERLPARIEARDASASHDALRAVFGAREQTPLDAGLARMAAWARDAGPVRDKPGLRLEIE